MYAIFKKSPFSRHGFIVQLLYHIREGDDHGEYQACHKQPFHGSVRRIPYFLSRPVEEPVEHITDHASITDDANDLTGKCLETTLLVILAIENQFTDALAYKQDGKHADSPYSHDDHREIHIGVVQSDMDQKGKQQDNEHFGHNAICGVYLPIITY